MDKEETLKQLYAISDMMYSLLNRLSRHSVTYPEKYQEFEREVLLPLIEFKWDIIGMFKQEIEKGA